MRVVVEQLGNEAELARARLRTQRQVGDHYHQGLVAQTKTREQGAAAGNASGQGVVDHFARRQA